jgi:hypothetical protein
MRKLEPLIERYRDILPLFYPSSLTWNLTQLASIGGRTGGWDPRDHDSFLKVLTVMRAHGNNDLLSRGVKDPTGTDKIEFDPDFVARFINFIPGKSASDIEDHLRW